MKSKRFSFLITRKLIKKRYQNEHHIMPFKTDQNKHVTSVPIFNPSKLHQKSTWNWRGFSPIAITLNKVRRNYVDFSTIQITSKKVSRNDVNFLPIEITSKRYVKMTWRFVDIFLSMYRRNIDMESTSIRRVVFFGYVVVAKWQT